MHTKVCSANCVSYDATVGGASLKRRIIQNQHLAGDKTSSAADAELIPADRNPILIKAQHRKVSPFAVLAALRAGGTPDYKTVKRKCSLRIGRCRNTHQD